MLDKKEVIKSINEMPGHFSIDDAIDRLIILNKIEKARKEIKAGEGVTTEQAKKKLQKWLK